METLYAELSANLSRRRNLESHLRPIEDIGSLDFPARWETDQQFHERREASRDRKRKERKELGMTPKQIKTEIARLKVREDELWRLCRPDLYESGVCV